MANRNMSIAIAGLLVMAVIGEQWVREQPPQEGSPIIIYVRKHEAHSPKVISRERRAVTVYAPRYHGRVMSDGGRYDHFNYSLASNRYPLGTTLRLTWKGRSVVAKVRDRMARGEKGVDASGAAFHALYPSYNGCNGTRLTGTLVEVMK